MTAETQARLAEPELSVWRAVCRYDEMLSERGVAALVGSGQVALFRLADGALHALANRDPYSGANVLSRGIVGSRAGRPTVASPMFKQVFDLGTGQALDDPDTRVPVHGVRIRAGVVEVQT